jgi:hypothetical protein
MVWRCGGVHEKLLARPQTYPRGRQSDLLEGVWVGNPELAPVEPFQPDSRALIW